MAKNSVKTRTILEMLDSLIEHHHLLKHPFYRAWTEGSLPKESLQLYAEQYYQHVRAFPENLKQLSGRTSGKLAELVEENISPRNSIPRRRIRCSGASSRTRSA